MPSIKAVIFDYGFVLSMPPSLVHMGNLVEACGLSIEKFKAEYKFFRKDFDQGLINGRKYWERLLKNNKISYSLKMIKYLISEDIKAWLEINPNMIDWAMQLKSAGIKIAILSNMPEDHGKYIMKHCQWIRQFDVITFSYKIKRVKPEPEIYQYCLKQLNLSPFECVFIDDLAPNVKTAEMVGIKGIMVDKLKDEILVLHKEYGFPLFKEGELMESTVS